MFHPKVGDRRTTKRPPAWAASAVPIEILQMRTRIRKSVLAEGHPGFMAWRYLPDSLLGERGIHQLLDFS